MEIQTGPMRLGDMTIGREEATVLKQSLRPANNRQTVE